MSVVILMALACTGGALAPMGDLPPVALDASVSARKVEAGGSIELTMRVSADEGWSFEAGGPAAEGLVVTPLDSQTLGPASRSTSVLTYDLSAPDGSYVVPPLQVRFVGPQGEERVESVGPFYLDFGVDGPGSQLQELSALQPEPPSRWPWVALGALVVLGLAVLVLRSRPGAEAEVRVAPPPPPDVEALTAWAAARADAELDDHGLALALSSIFRRYLERALGLPATRLTSFELLDRLADQAGITSSLHGQAGRLLGATDLIKFARQGGGEVLFDGLDGDLRALIDATRPAERQAAEAGDV